MDTALATKRVGLLKLKAEESRKSWVQIPADPPFQDTCDEVCADSVSLLATFLYVGFLAMFRLRVRFITVMK